MVGVTLKTPIEVVEVSLTKFVWDESGVEVEAELISKRWAPVLLFAMILQREWG